MPFVKIEKLFINLTVVTSQALVDSSCMHPDFIDGDYYSMIGK